MSLPNQLTALRIVLAPLFYILFAVAAPPHYGWAVGVFIVAAVTDWYDGYFARRLGKMTPFGAFFDPLADKVLTSVAFVAFAATGLVPWWCVVLIVLRDVYLTVFRMAADSLRQSIRTTTFAKYKTFFQMAFISYVLLVLLAREGDFGTALANTAGMLMQQEWLLPITLLVTSLTLLTALKYSFDNSAVLSRIMNRYILGKSTQA
ncbi:MAG: CDP-diacylglycerol--glycerol-3-phosphate 3-phosphatidyltransferase [Bacteroidetes bacterium]|nr:CDP-diacylglycerol--glycerol-3-phosphate 3-phosphatidyltransferase [Bacteroidota bacterium]